MEIEKEVKKQVEIKVERKQFDDERRSLVARLEDWLETPLLILGFV